jgi:hypothetical protein
MKKLIIALTMFAGIVANAPNQRFSYKRNT